MKKGELTTQQIVILIILIVSFLIILFLLFRLSLGATSQKEICHNSVITRGKSLFTEALDCKTDYICISGGGDCENFISSSKIEIKLDEKSKESIMKVLADQMSSCWWTFGEGKINYGTSGGTSLKCAICSIIRFDGKIQESLQSISYKEFYDYLEKTKKDEAKTYLAYLYTSWSLDSLKISSEFNVPLDGDSINTAESYSIITGIDDNLFNSDSFLETVLIKSKETSTKTKCEEFVTKA